MKKKSFMLNILNFLKKEIVFFIAMMLAIVSCFFVKPNANYINYIDFDVLIILLSLMIIVGCLQSQGVFQNLAFFLTSKIKSFRIICFLLIFLCFFLSMFITNDVALITFVPFAILLLEKLKKEQYILPIVILQTIGANCGSMLTPIGNPQNLFLFSQMQINLFSFIKIMAPYTILSFILLCLCIIFIKEDTVVIKNSNYLSQKKLPTIFYLFSFIITLLSVLNIAPSWIALSIAIVSSMIFNPKEILKVDYMLLLTFIAFFIFTGNIGNIQSVKNLLSEFVKNKEMLCSILSSQIISNVPATLLLYPFSQNITQLLIGVNLGGLGTLIASLASLISFKFYSNSEFQGKKSISNYLFIFTIINIAFLLIEILFALILFNYF